MRAPDFIIGGANDPYLRRWWLIPRNRWFNIYLHQFLHSDDDRALHDHPYWNVSILLRGSYLEHIAKSPTTYMLRRRGPGAIVFRRPRTPHRIELLTEHEWGGPIMPVWTLFITGPRVREWGFHCPKGWVPWQVFTAPGDKGSIGKGCGE